MTADRPPFQRARNPEQVRARRTAILTAARELLSRHPLADISLRELSRHAGLAKSNVLRYFDSREAVYLALLDVEWGAWLDALETAPAPPVPDAPFAAETALARTMASTLAERPELCELASVTASVLERNIGVDTALEFKRRVAVHSDRLAALAEARVPGLDRMSADRFASTAVVLAAAFWPFANPNESVRAAIERLGHAPAPFADGLAATLADLLIGLTCRGGHRTGRGDDSPTER